jgi:WD40 repeat protein
LEDCDQTQPVKTFGASTADHYKWVTPAGVRFNPDGTLLAMSTREDTVTLWNVRTGQAVPPVLYGHIKSISSVDFRNDGKVLASGSEDGDIRLWDVGTHELLGTLGAKQKAIKSVVFSPHNDVLASVGEDDSIIVLGRRVRRLIRPRLSDRQPESHASGMGHLLREVAL